MDIRKSKDNFNKDRKLMCFNYNTYRHMEKECQRPKKDTKKYYKCNKVEHLAKDCRLGQRIKNRNIQENINRETNDKQESFVRGSE